MSVLVEEGRLADMTSTGEEPRLARPGASSLSRWLGIAVGWLTLLALLAAATGTGYGQELKRQERSGLLRLAQDYERFGDYERALSIYERLLAVSPISQVYWEGVKRNLLLLKRYDTLLRRIEQRLAMRWDPRLEADLADVNFKLGRTDEARKI